MENATHIEVDARVRYWEDASVNGVSDEDGKLIFGANDENWKVKINLLDGSIEGWPNGMEAEIHYKVCDEGEYWLLSAAGGRIAKWKGYYVPNAFLCHGSEGYGDYIIVNVGTDGVISGYERPEIDPEEWRAFA